MLGPLRRLKAQRTAPTALHPLRVMGSIETPQPTVTNLNSCKPLPALILGPPRKWLTNLDQREAFSRAGHLFVRRQSMSRSWTSTSQARGQ